MIVIAGTPITNVIGGLVAERVWKALGTMRLIVVAGLTIPTALAIAAHTTSPAIAAACFAAESSSRRGSWWRPRHSVPAAMRGKVMNLTRTFVIGSMRVRSKPIGP